MIPNLLMKVLSHQFQLLVKLSEPISEPIEAQTER